MPRHIPNVLDDVRLNLTSVAVVSVVRKLVNRKLLSAERRGEDEVWRVVGVGVVEPDLLLGSRVGVERWANLPVAQIIVRVPLEVEALLLEAFLCNLITTRVEVWRQFRWSVVGLKFDVTSVGQLSGWNLMSLPLVSCRHSKVSFFYSYSRHIPFLLVRGLDRIYPFLALRTHQQEPRRGRDWGTLAPPTPPPPPTHTHIYTFGQLSW